jgi:hypothetical protein
VIDLADGDATVARLGRGDLARLGLRADGTD